MACISYGYEAAGRYEPKIAIIGAGISGLAAAKHLSQYGPVVFEASGSVGGVWRHCSFRSTRLQTPRMDYEFSDHQWEDREDLSFPTHTEILEYLEGYATRFGIWKNIRLNTKVVELKYLGGEMAEEGKAGVGGGGMWGEAGGRAFAGKPMWEVVVQSNQSETVEVYKFDFVVMCMGKYGDVPSMPSFPAGRGPEVFRGKVLHTLDYCKLSEEESRELVGGKKTVVVGYKKSGIDLAVECAEANQGPDGQPCTMLIRTLHWTVPSYSIWGLPFYLFFSTRFSQFIHERPDQGKLRSLFCSIASPMRHGVSKFIESYLSWKLPLQKYGLKPEHPFVEDYASCQMAILPDNFFHEADKGLIRFQKAPARWWFRQDGVELEDGTKIDADVVFLATGYDGKSKLTSVLPPTFCDALVDNSGIIPLYRGTVHPRIPHMAFLGYVESVSNLHTSELRCKWLASLMDDRFALPAVEEMVTRVEEEAAVARRSTRFHKRHCISTYSITHSDGMCTEMGWEAWRKKGGWLTEAFSPYNNQDYKED